MAIERERSIAVSVVMSFEHEGLNSNLLDPPDHQDFSPKGDNEDAYRTLTEAAPTFPPLLAGEG
jgi:peptide subunit release factor RF-3